LLGTDSWLGFTLADTSALLVFALAWLAYHFLVENSRSGTLGLNALMNQDRLAWMRQMERRELRIIDTQIMASLQNGTAFFASTSLIAIGASVGLLRDASEVFHFFAELPLGAGASRTLWEAKVVGLAVIFVYAFFKFSWSYRLFNYAAIMMGATPMPGDPDGRKRSLAARRAAEMNIVAARHFNRGQRAFFFALAYLGWFLSPYVLMATTFYVLYVMWARQYLSDARRAATFEAADEPEPGVEDQS
jgi:uncharacterized membrane protein